MLTKFWKTVSINSASPHIINKRVSGMKILSSAISRNECSFCDKLSIAGFLSTLSTVMNSDTLLEILNGLNHWTKLEDNAFSWESVDDDEYSGVQVMYNLRKLFSKGQGESNMELEVICFSHSKVTYIPINNPHFKVLFQIFESSDNIELWTDFPETREFHWLSSVYLPKMKQWYATTNEQSGMKSNHLVDDEEYQILYQSLKLKYGQEMVKIWPECTDPAKFVYEDLAIASYLLLILKAERKKSGNTTMQSFLDIGCGNGLLVYILASEGHPGKGIDIRSRKIWSLYPKFVKLEVGTVRPDSSDLAADWLIGNHSDELTPWMPVFAAKFNINYFVLPCCQFNFFGKFQRPKNATEDSKYQNYLAFVEKIGLTCGFEVSKDRLKIPSTKRICYVGTDRRVEVTMDTINAFIQSQVPEGQRPDSINWDTYFTARDAVEPVRNCTRIDPIVKIRVVNLIVSKLLEKSENFLELNGRKWNAGKTLMISEIVSEVSKEDLSAMKNECGGLQTLLRNHSHIFLVLEGTVRLRSPSEMSVSEYRESKGGKRRKKEVVLKKKNCWFFANHQDGCPCPDDQCRFLHTVT